MTGLPISTYFSAYKLKWLMANNKDVAEAVKSKKAYLGQQTLLLMCFVHTVLLFLAFASAYKQISGQMLAFSLLMYNKS